MATTNWILGLALIALVLCTQGAQADCNQPAADAVTHVSLAGHPFSAIPSADGCTIFISLSAAKDSHIVVLKRDDGVVTLLHDSPAEGALTGMALSPDGRFLVAANGTGVTLFDTAKLVAGADKPALGYLNDRPGAGSIYTAFTPDERFLFVSDERTQALTVYDFAGLFTGRGAKPVGEVRTADTPVGLAFSPDGKQLYSTSEVASASGGCRENGRGSHGEGVLMVVDVARAATDPSTAVLSRVSAGCNPVRVALSPDGGTVYVTARGQNTLLVFDAAKLLDDREHALTAQIAVGISPVGVVATKDKLFVTNSNRFGGGANQSVSVLNAHDPSATQLSIPAGGFPRELKLTADSNTLLVTNFASGTLELVDLARLAQVAQ